MNLTKHIYFESVETKFKILKNKFADQPESKLQKLAEIIEQRKLDLNKIKEEEIDGILSSKTKSEAKRKGIEGLVKGVDYIEVPLKVSGAEAYIPLNHKASKAIAGSKHLCPVDAKWCTAQNNPENWLRYFSGGEGMLIYIMDPKAKKDKYSKIAFYYYGFTWDAWDANDEILNKKIARRIIAAYGISLGTLYKRFKSKEIQKTVDLESKMYAANFSNGRAQVAKVIIKNGIHTAKEFEDAMNYAYTELSHNPVVLDAIFKVTNLDKKILLDSHRLRDLKDGLDIYGYKAARLLLEFAKRYDLYDKKTMDEIARYAKGNE